MDTSFRGPPFNSHPSCLGLHHPKAPKPCPYPPQQGIRASQYGMVVGVAQKEHLLTTRNSDPAPEPRTLRSVAGPELAQPCGPGPAHTPALGPGCSEQPAALWGEPSGSVTWAPAPEVHFCFLKKFLFLLFDCNQKAYLPSYRSLIA